jgi:hypothetical protein
MVTALGWVFSPNVVLPPNGKVMVVLAIVTIGAIAAVMAVAYGGFALGARVYKEQVLVSEFHRILRLDENILRPMRALRSAPVRRVFLLATGLLSGFHVILNMVLYVGPSHRGNGFCKPRFNGCSWELRPWLGSFCWALS